MSELLNGDEKVADVIKLHPYCKEVFVSHGFTKIMNPMMLKTVAQKVTLKMACKMKGVNLDGFLEQLNRIISQEEKNE